MCTYIFRHIFGIKIIAFQFNLDAQANCLICLLNAKWQMDGKLLLYYPTIYKRKKREIV